MVGPLAIVVEDELCGSQGNGRVGKVAERRDAWAFLLVDDLARHLTDEFFRQRRLGHDVLRRVRLPRDRQANVAADLTVAVARRASHAPFGVALQTILRAGQSR